MPAFPYANLMRLVAYPLAWLRERNPGAPTEAAALGRWGEDVAARNLRRHGYRLLARNYRPRHGGEVDIVARHKPTATLCFIEVKTRRSDRFGRPSRAVDEKKQRLIVRGALSWLRLLDRPDVSFRFDIVEVVAEDPPQITILENAFQLPPEMFVG
jgi:putative endonuclease